MWIGLVPALCSAEVIRHTTPAGHVFHYVQMPEADRTAIVVDWKSGWAHGAEHPTTAHMGAILMTISGAGGTLEELIGALNAAGARAELDATADGARGLLVARDGQLDEAAALARDALTNTRLDAAAFESIRDELSRAVRAIEPPAKVLVEDAARRLLLGDAPLDDFLRLPVDDIEGATLSEVRAWRNAVFAQANATVAAAGVAPAADVAAAVDTLLEDLPESPAGEPARAPQPAYGGKTVLIVDPDAESATIGVFGLMPSTGALRGMLNVLALETLDRRIARRLRRVFGDAYDISVRPANYARDVRLLAIEGEVATSDLKAVLEVTRRTYERFRARGPTPRQAANAAARAARMFEGVEDKPEAVAQIVAELVLDQEFATIADDLPGRLRAVEPRELTAHVQDAFPAWDEMLRVVVATHAEAAAADCVIDTLDPLETCR
jgi:predicted Zn-dependent peptidase